MLCSLLGQAAGEGRPLELPVRVGLERWLGTDLGHVRIHTGSAAAASAEALSARAYTVGHHVVFGPGQYRPDDASGRAVLAHELAHVVQQQAGGHAAAGSPSSERAADDVAHGTTSGMRVASAGTVSVTGGAVAVAGGGTAVGIARQAKEAAPAPAPDDSLGSVSEIAVELATHAVAGSGVQQEMLKAGLRGFIAELGRQVRPGEQIDKLKSSLRELMVPANAADFAIGSSAGFTAGMISPVTDLVGLGAFAEQLPMIATNLAKKAWAQAKVLGEEAMTLAREASDFIRALPKRLADFLKDRKSLDEVLADVRARALTQAAEAGHGAARLIVGFFTEKDPKPARKDESFRQVLTTHSEEEKAGWISFGMGKLERIRKVLLNTPWQDFGYKVGHALGAVVSNLLIFIFSDGIGNAVAKIGAELGRLAPILAKGAEAIVAVGEAIAFVESKIGALISGGIKMVKPLEAMVTPLFRWLERFQGWLRKLFGVAEKGAAKAAVLTGEAAAEKVGAKAATKAPGRAAAVKAAAPEAAVKAAAPEAAVKAAAPEAAVKAAAPEASETVAKAAAPEARAAGPVAPEARAAGSSTPPAGQAEVPPQRARVAPQDDQAIEAAMAEGPTGTGGTYSGPQRLARGNFGEKAAADALAHDGFEIIDYKPNIAGTNQGGIDIVAMRGDTLYVIDNKALTRSGNVASVSALTTNYPQNLASVRAELVQRIAGGGPPEQIRALERALEAIDSGRVVRAVTNANLAPDDTLLSGVTDNLRGQGIDFIDVMRPPPGAAAAEGGARAGGTATASAVAQPAAPVAVSEAAPVSAAAPTSAPPVPAASSASSGVVAEELPRIRVAEEAPKVRVAEEAPAAQELAEPVNTPPKLAMAASAPPRARASSASAPVATAEVKATAPVKPTGPVKPTAPVKNTTSVKPTAPVKPTAVKSSAPVKPTAPLKPTPVKPTPVKPTPVKPRSGPSGSPAPEGLPEGSRMDEVLEEFAAEQERWAPGNKERFGPEGKRSSNLTESPTRHQKLEISRPSDELAEAMAEAGNPRPPGHSTHHIVADADERAAEAREILIKVGINPRNDWRNGVHLPQNVGNPRTVPEAYTQHATLHTDSYYDTVNDRLREAYTGTGHYENSPILDPATRVEDELARLYEDIAQGELPHPRKRD